MSRRERLRGIIHGDVGTPNMMFHQARPRGWRR